MANLKRGEVAFPPAGEDAFFMFSLSEGEELEAKFGEDFFEQIEIAARNGVMGKLLHCVRVGLKRRDQDGRAQKIITDRDDFGFHWTEAIDPVLDALSLCVANMTYAELLAKAAEEQAKRDSAALKGLKEAAEEAGVPLSDEALVSALLKLRQRPD